MSGELHLDDRHPRAHTDPEPGRRWGFDENARFVVSLVLAALVAYFTTSARVDVLAEREQLHYAELVKSNSEIKATLDKLLDELRRRP